MMIHLSKLLVLLPIIFMSCGKVVQDITTESNQNQLKSATFDISLDSDFPKYWQSIIPTKNSVMVYSYYQGVKLGTGLEKLGWSSAEVVNDVSVSPNVIKVTNYDSRRNTVISSRHQQGVIGLSRQTSVNVKLTSKYNKVRPSYSYYSIVHYLNNDQFIMSVSEEITSKTVTITPYSHLISSLYMTHLQKESYAPEGVIPLQFFKTIIPTQAAVTSKIEVFVSNNQTITANVVVIPTENLFPINQSQNFDVKSPVFYVSSKFSDSLIGTVSLAKYSDKLDVVDYINSQSDVVFTDSLKQILTQSVTDYFDLQASLNVTANASATINASVTSSPNAIE